jgi:hypothetical protein
MKITAIVCAGSDDNHTAFRTEPAATKEVVEFAMKNYLAEPSPNKYSVKNGLFIVAQTWIPKEQVTVYEDALTDAEIFLGKKSALFSEKELSGQLRERAKRAGLSLE